MPSPLVEAACEEAAASQAEMLLSDAAREQELWDVSRELRGARLLIQAARRNRCDARKEAELAGSSAEWVSTAAAQAGYEMALWEEERRIEREIEEVEALLASPSSSSMQSPALPTPLRTVPAYFPVPPGARQVAQMGVQAQILPSLAASTPPSFRSHGRPRLFPHLFRDTGGARLVDPLAPNAPAVAAADLARDARRRGGPTGLVEHPAPAGVARELWPKLAVSDRHPLGTAHAGLGQQTQAGVQAGAGAQAGAQGWVQAPVGSAAQAQGDAAAFVHPASELRMAAVAPVRNSPLPFDERPNAGHPNTTGLSSHFHPKPLPASLNAAMHRWCSYIEQRRLCCALSSAATAVASRTSADRAWRRWAIVCVDAAIARLSLSRAEERARAVVMGRAFRWVRVEGAA
eukprot:scaffold2661_cov120-Isochrysis_galbana.AAC.1